MFQERFRAVLPPLKADSTLWQRMLVLCVGLLLWLVLCNAAARDSTAIGVIEWADLPKEARQTVVLLRHGGPFPYPKDGTVFGNYEGVLPKQKRGYYHEFTVKTPGKRGRGARRLVVGGNWQTSRELYYTDNHYASFRRIKE